MRLSRETIFKLHKTIKELDSKKYNKYFLLACHMNKKTLEPIVFEIEKSANQIITKDFSEFKKSYDELQKSYQESPSEEIGTKIETLIEESRSAIEEYKKRDADFGVWVKEDVEVELKEIAFENIPDELDKNVFDNLVILFKE